MQIKGKIAIWFWCILVGVNIAMIYEIVTTGAAKGLLFIVFILIFFNSIFVPMVIKNYVEIDDEKMTLVLGLCKDSIKIEDIIEVYRTHNPISAGALSLDRVVIKGRRQEMIISVCDKEQLFHELKQRNPKIQIRR